MITGLTATQEQAMPLHTLENELWQVGVLPETGSSTAFGRVRRGGRWLDIMRPTSEADYGNASLCASFIMLPWCNRLRDARFRFEGREYALQPSSADGTAIHGTVRRLPWQVASAEPLRVVTTFDSAAQEPDKINFPFRFSARSEFRLDKRDFVTTLTLRNEDSQPFPAGFGHHPYFVRDADNRVQIQIPCDEHFELVDALASAPPVPLPPELDFREVRPLGTRVYEHLLTTRANDLAARIVYPEASVSMLADPLFRHVLLFAPEGKPFFAIEPQSNANDGFNLYEQNIAGNGVFVLQPGESKSGTVTLRLE
jgi:aldose 1-epimerase